MKQAPPTYFPRGPAGRQVKTEFTHKPGFFRVVDRSSMGEDYSVARCFFSLSEQTQTRLAVVRLHFLFSSSPRPMLGL